MPFTELPNLSFSEDRLSRTTGGHVDDDSGEGGLRGDETLIDLVAARRARVLGIYLAISFLVGVAATLLLPPPRLPVPLAQVLGPALVGAGLVVIGWAVKTMVRGGTSPDPHSRVQPS